MALQLFRAILHSVIAEVSLDLDQLRRRISKRYSSLTVDYEEYFKLTVDFYFDRGRRW